MDLPEYQKLKARAERLRRELGRAEGALQEALRRLQEEHGVSSLEEGEAAARAKEGQAIKFEGRAQRLLEKLYEEHGERLRGEGQE